MVTRVLGIPCPWSGDERDPTPCTYWAWFWLYRTVRRVEHAIGRHDWRTRWPEGGPPHQHCDWCGAHRPLREGT